MSPEIRVASLKDQKLFLESVARSQSLHEPFTKAPSTPEEFANYIEQYSKPDHRSWLVYTAEDEIAGVFNLSQIVRGCFQSGYLGFYVMHPFEGKGLMSAGLKQVLAEIFGELGLHRVEANIQPDNLASIRLVKKNGFHYEGYSPNYLKIADEWRAHERWALTLEDYQKKPVAGEGGGIRIVYEENPAESDIRILAAGIDKNTRIKTGFDPIAYFGYFLRDETGAVRGGCNGEIYYGCLYIDQLWVDEGLRGQGYGIQLMQAAEKLGKQKGSKFSTVNTMNWEALEFYRKLGYFVELERKGYLKNSVLYVLRKNFHE